jgi:hypothetical protein
MALYVAFYLGVPPQYVFYHIQYLSKNFYYYIISYAGILKLDAVDAVDAVDALHPHLLKLDAVHPVPTKTGCSASSIY